MGTGRRHTETHEAARQSRPAMRSHARAEEESPFGLLGGAGNAAIASLLRRDRPVQVPSSLVWTPGRIPHLPVQRYTITKRGKEEHHGLVGKPGYGEEGPTTGGVSVRTGEEIAKADGTKVPNVIALEYSGAASGDSHWVQFVWHQMTAETPRGHEILSGSGPTLRGPQPFTTSSGTPTWWVDTAPGGNPFYEAGGANIRDNSSITMLDVPGTTEPGHGSPFSLKPDATSMIYTLHFDTYLIQNNQAAYRVAYTATAGYRPGPGDPTSADPIQAKVDYHVVKGEPVIGLPDTFIAILRKNFPKFSKIH